jgi:uroporphyrin-3 C-methyltransferase
MSDTEQPAAKQPAAAAPRRGGALALVALLLAVGVACAGYYWTRFVAEPGVSALRAQLDDVRAERDELSKRLTATDERVRQLAAAQSAAQTSVDELRNTTGALTQSVKSLAAHGGDKTLDWVLAECEYLILAASQRLALEQDVATARAALMAGDERLHGIDHPAVGPVREQLARDIQALAAVAEPDIQGLSLKFAAQIRKAGTLHTKPIAAVDTSFKRSREEKITPDNWRGVLQAMWDDLMSLVEIKDDELPDGVLFDPKLRYFIEQNLKLELSSARLAILERDTTNFRVAVEIVQEALARYYDPSDAAVKALAEMLADVRGIDLAPALPNVTASLDAVRAARQALASLPVPAQPATQPAAEPPAQP